MKSKVLFEINHYWNIIILFQAASAMESFEKMVDVRLEDNVMLQNELDEARDTIRQLQNDINGIAPQYMFILEWNSYIAIP